MQYVLFPCCLNTRNKILGMFLVCVHIANLKKTPHCGDKLVRVNNSYTKRPTSLTRIWEMGGGQGNSD